MKLAPFLQFSSQNSVTPPALNKKTSNNTPNQVDCTLSNLIFNSSNEAILPESLNSDSSSSSSLNSLHSSSPPNIPFHFSNVYPINTIPSSLLGKISLPNLKPPTSDNVSSKLKKYRESHNEGIPSFF